MRNQQVKSRSFKILFDKKVMKLSEQYFFQSAEKEKTLHLGLNLATLLVWVNLSWIGKTAEKLTM